jgi:DNA repair protein RadC
MNISEAEKYNNKEISSMSDLEILELILSLTEPPETAHTAARQLTECFGSLCCILERSPLALKGCAPLSNQTLVMLNMQSALFRRCAVSKNRFNRLTEDNLELFVRSLFIGCSTEMFFMISLDDKGVYIAETLLSGGTSNKTSVYTRGVIEAALRTNARSVIFAHNHPNGIALPSSEDIVLTYTLYDALEAINVKLLDHIVITEKTMVSIRNDMHAFENRRRHYDAQLSFE